MTKTKTQTGINSPSKYVSRKFLRYLIENHFISKGGKEYAAHEVFEMYREKCARLGPLDFIRDLKQQAEQATSGGALPPLMPIQNSTFNRRIKIA